MGLISFPGGISVNGAFYFNDSHLKKRFKLEVNKIEKKHIYDLAITFLGTSNKGEPHWQITINRQELMYPNNQYLLYKGSKKFVTEYFNNGTIKIAETYTNEERKNAISNVWIDVLASPYVVSDQAIIRSEVEKAISQ